MNKFLKSLVKIGLDFLEQPDHWPRHSQAKGPDSAQRD